MSGRQENDAKNRGGVSNVEKIMNGIAVFAITISLAFGTFGKSGTIVNRVEAAEGDIPITEEYFPDEKFRLYVKDFCDSDNDGFLSKKEIDSATDLYLPGSLAYPYEDMESLEGIEYLSELKSLDLSMTYLKRVDVSKNLKLEELYISELWLESLYIGDAPNLQSIMMGKCRITGDDIDKYRNREVLDVTEANEVTCTEDGHTKGVKCPVCGRVLVKQDITPAKGYHEWDNGVISKSPSENEVGEMLYTCLVCYETKTMELNETHVVYSTQVQNYGWMKTASDGQMSGTSGESKRLETIKIELNSNADLGVQYTTHCQTYGWLPWSANGEMNGTEGESKRLEAIKIQLTGNDADKYDIFYRVHAQNYGWLGWAKNGEMAGTAGLSKRLEGIQIIVQEKEKEKPTNVGGIVSAYQEAQVTGNGAESDPWVKGEQTSNIAVRTHVQSYGWQGWKYNGQMAGTSGKSKRLEGINIKLTNQQYEGGVEYRTHVQNYGWMAWKKDGEMSGTSGESKRLEAIQIRLTGDMAEHFDVYYRVHAQSYGWLGWAKNGEEAGTAGGSRRLEAIQVVLVEKGTEAPGNVSNIVSVRKEAYIDVKEDLRIKSMNKLGNYIDRNGEYGGYQATYIQFEDGENYGYIRYDRYYQHFQFTYVDIENDDYSLYSYIRLSTTSKGIKENSTFGNLYYNSDDIVNSDYYDYYLYSDFDFSYTYNKPLTVTLRDRVSGKARQAYEYNKIQTDSCTRAMKAWNKYLMEHVGINLGHLGFTNAEYPFYY